MQMSGCSSECFPYLQYSAPQLTSDSSARPPLSAWVSCPSTQLWGVLAVRKLQQSCLFSSPRDRSLVLSSNVQKQLLHDSPSFLSVSQWQLGKVTPLQLPADTQTTSFNIVSDRVEFKSTFFCSFPICLCCLFLLSAFFWFTWKVIFSILL